MNVRVEDAGPCRKTLRIELPAQRVGQEFESVLKEFVGVAKIPGFRPGKAPKDIVKRHYGKQIEDEVKDRLVPAGYHEALEEQKLEPVAVLNVENIRFKMGEPMEFTVTLDVPPQFTLPSYKGMALQGKKIEVTDKEVDAAVQDMLEQRARWNEVTGRPVQKGDLVQIDYDGACEGTPVEEIAPKAAGLGKGKDFWMRADENAFLPGFEQGLVGAAVGEKKQVQVVFPADFQEKAVAGKTCAYAVDVKAIREKKAPALDAEFLKVIGAESEEKLRERIREELRSVGESFEKQRLKNELVKGLLEKTKLDVPESVVQQETRDTVYEIVRENSYRGIPREQIEEKKGEIFETASRTAVEKVKARYILHRISVEEKIEVSDEDVSARVQDMAARYNVTPQQFRAEMEKRGSIDDIREDLRINKTLDALLEQAKIQV